MSDEKSQSHTSGDTKRVPIGVVADTFQVTPEAVRQWESKGWIPASYRTPGGHRRYGMIHFKAIQKLCGDPVIVSEFSE